MNRHLWPLLGSEDTLDARGAELLSIAQPLAMDFCMPADGRRPAGEHGIEQREDQYGMGTGWSK